MKLPKKLTFAALSVLIGATSFGVSAQEAAAVTSVTTEQTEVFNPHWFLQAQGGVGYTFGESESTSDMISPAAALYGGYRFNPLFGLRFGLSGWQGRGSWVEPRMDYKFNYLQGNVDAMLSLTNLFCGYKPGRLIDSYLFLGVGVNGGFNNDEAVDLNAQGYKFLNLWEGHKIMWAGRAGLGLSFNLSRLFAINLEVNGNMLPDDFNSKKGTVFDWQLNGLVGVSFKFGSTRPAKVQIVEEAEMEIVPAPRPQPVEPVEPAPAREEEKKDQTAARQTVAETVAYDIFFSINSSVISDLEQSKIEQLAGYMKEHSDVKVVVTGYADKATGNSAFNMTLSQRRAEAVAAALVKAGVQSERISTVAKGDTEQPYTDNVKNRVAIAIAK
ncbi:MAG: OmpA family protein [Muribaculaceae bacterium]|nr:OmpA family protein [Muribaculaceae bacterium]